MRKIMLFMFLCPTLFFGQTTIGNTTLGGAIGMECGKAVAISGDGTTIAVGCPESDSNGVDSGEVRIYERSGNTWTYLTTLFGLAEGDKFGWSISLSDDGSRVAVGSPYSAAAEYGAFRVYQNNLGNWIQMGSTVYGAAQSNLGISVSLSSDGSFLAVGAGGGANTGYDAGLVQVYQFTGSAWAQVGNDMDGDMPNDRLGTSVSLSSDGTIVAVGAYGNDTNGDGSGQVKVFQNIANAWTQIGANINGEAVADGSGFSVSLSGNGNVVAIGAYSNDGNGADSGHVRVYQNASGTWFQKGTDIDGEASGDYSGLSVSLSYNGNVLIVGATGNDEGGPGDDFGQVRAYQYTTGAWTQVGVDMNGIAAGSNFGRSVSVSDDGNIVFAGGPYYNQNRGYCRAYDISTTLSVEEVAGHSQIKVFPNPAKEYLTIRLGNEMELQKADMYNNVGQLVLSSGNSQEINVAGLSRGIYLLEIQTNQGKEIRKIIVQ